MEAFLSKDVELELRFRARSPREILHVFKSLSEKQKPKQISSVALIDGFRRSEIFLEEGKPVRTENLTKKQLYSEIKTVDGRRFKLSIAKEEMEVEAPNPKTVRIKQRYRFELDVGGIPWFCDITLVKPCVAVISQIRPIRIAFFDRVSSGNLEPVDDEQLELELECQKPELVNEKNIDEAIKTIFADKTTGSSLSRLSQILGYRGYDATLKKLLPNAIELSKTTFVNQLWPRIQNGEFAVVDKADGERMILYASPAKIELIAGETIHPIVGTWSFKESIFECEVIETNGVRKVYIYDVLLFDGKNLVKETFKTRWDAVDKSSNLENVYFKKFVSLENYSTAIEERLDAKYDYHIDGLIFSSINRSYSAMEHYKWKPIETSSIDFLCKKAPSISGKKDIKTLSFEKRAGVVKVVEPDTYYLFCSISDRDFRGLGLRNLPGFSANKKQSIFPVHFCPSSNPKAYIFKYSGDEKIDGQIVEMGYTKSFNSVGREVPALRLMRIRHDRLDDLKKGYYGNYFRIAEFIWNNYNDPLTREMLIDPKAAITDFYFQKPSEEWINVRKHNNNVKRSLIMKYSKAQDWTIDLACGKGQDILKYRDAGVRNIVMVDSVPDNISQVIQRKYDILKGGARPIVIYTSCIDLKQPAAATFQEIKDSGIPMGDVGFIACNLAIHYLVDTSKQLSNTIKMFSQFCLAGTKIMITSLDGAKIFDLLKGGGTFRSLSGKFEIKKMWTGKSFVGCGQRISIKLPFADNPMEETLVNYKVIEREFKKYKIKLIDSGSFGKDYLKELTEEEREYIDLHKWTIWQA